MMVTARQRRTAMKVAIGILSLLVHAPCSGQSSTRTKRLYDPEKDRGPGVIRLPVIGSQVDELEPPSEAPEITAVALNALHNEDHVEASFKYNQKWILVHGRVNEITSHPDGRPVVKINSGEIDHEIFCVCAGVEKERVSRLKRDQHVGILGICVGKQLTFGRQVALVAGRIKPGFDSRESMKLISKDTYRDSGGRSHVTARFRNEGRSTLYEVQVSVKLYDADNAVLSDDSISLLPARIRPGQIGFLDAVVNPTLAGRAGRYDLSIRKANERPATPAEKQAGLPGNTAVHIGSSSFVYAKYYHTGSCEYLGGSTAAGTGEAGGTAGTQRIDRSEAVALGFARCPACKP
jgi:hypothetical protein